MSFALALIEVMGMTAAVPLMFASRKALENIGASTVSHVNRNVWFATATLLVAVGIAIVWFATDAAMTGGEADLSAAFITP